MSNPSSSETDHICAQMHYYINKKMLVTGKKEQKDGLKRKKEITAP